MLKTSGLYILLICCSLALYAAPASVKTDKLVTILQLKEQKACDRQLIAELKGIFASTPIPQLNSAKAKVHNLFIQYHTEGVPAFDSFIESLCWQRYQKLNEAEAALVKAIVEARKINDHYLQYSLYSHLSFLQTYRGNTIAAVSNFRMAKKEAIAVNDADLQVVIDINIFDIYYKNNLYDQSLIYLNQADSLVNTHQASEPRLKNIVYFNKAEIYFRMSNLDSLKKYNAILNDGKRGTYKIYIFRRRTNYYLSLLQHKYKKAIKYINALKKDTLYRFDDSDEQYLADAYYNAGRPDSAKATINRLLAEPAQNNHPEITSHLYKLLGQIAEKGNDPIEAARNYKMAMLQLEDQVGRLTKVGDISSSMKIDEVHSDYIRKEEALKRERLWLIFTVIVSLLTIAVVAISYRTIKQKRYYEQLLFTTKKEELSFINSHEVRRHLSNILGIIDIIKHSENKHEEYLNAEDHLLNAAESLDESIKNISDKLDKD